MTIRDYIPLGLQKFMVAGALTLGLAGCGDYTEQSHIPASADASSYQNIDAHIGRTSKDIGVRLRADASQPDTQTETKSGSYGWDASTENDAGSQDAGQDSGSIDSFVDNALKCGDELKSNTTYTQTKNIFIPTGETCWKLYNKKNITIICDPKKYISGGLGTTLVTLKDVDGFTLKNCEYDAFVSQNKSNAKGVWAEDSGNLNFSNNEFGAVLLGYVFSNPTGDVSLEGNEVIIAHAGDGGKGIYFQVNKKIPLTSKITLKNNDIIGDYFMGISGLNEKCDEGIAFHDVPLEVSLNGDEVRRCRGGIDLWGSSNVTLKNVRSKLNRNNLQVNDESVVDIQDTRLCESEEKDIRYDSIDPKAKAKITAKGNRCDTLSKNVDKDVCFLECE
jgi:hypothetical protein